MANPMRGRTRTRKLKNGLMVSVAMHESMKGQLRSTSARERWSAIVWSELTGGRIQFCKGWEGQAISQKCLDVEISLLASSTVTTVPVQNRKWGSEGRRDDSDSIPCSHRSPGPSALIPEAASRQAIGITFVHLQKGRGSGSIRKAGEQDAERTTVRSTTSCGGSRGALECLGRRYTTKKQ